MGISRRNVIAGASTAIAAAVVGPRRAFSQREPIKIGAIIPLSTTQQILGNYIKIGMDMAASHINAAGGVDGRNVEIVYYDDAGNPSNAVSGMRELTSKGIRLLASSSTTTQVAAITPLLESANATTMSLSSGLPLTHESYVPQFFRMNFSLWGGFTALGKRVVETHGETRKWAAICSDTAAAAALAKVFYQSLRKYHRANGVEVELVEPAFVKVGAGDYRNQLAAIGASGATGMMNAVLGADNITVYKQLKQMGLSQQIKVFTDGGGPDLQIGKALGTECPTIYVALPWIEEAQKNPVSQRFVAEYKKQTGDDRPSYYASTYYDVVQIYAAAVKALGNDLSDNKKIVAAIENADVLGVNGRIRFRKQDHQLMGTISVAEFSGDASNSAGWSVKSIASVPSEDVIEPPSPGKELSIPNPL